MSEVPNTGGREDQDRLGAVGAATGIGCSIVVTLIVFIGGGIALDEFTDKSPLFTLIGVVIGLIGAGYELFELAQIGRKDRSPGPLTRGLGSVVPRHGPLSSTEQSAAQEQRRPDQAQGEE